MSESELGFSGDVEIIALTEKESTDRNYVFEERKIRCVKCGEIIGYEQFSDEKESRFENQIPTEKSNTVISNIICTRCRNQST